MPDDLDLSQLQATLTRPLVPQSGPGSTLGGLGVALGGLGAGLQGQPNPVLHQLQQQRESEFRQQAELLRLQQSVQQQRFQRNKLLLDLGKDLLQSEGGRETGAKVIAGALGQMNLLPPGLSGDSLISLLGKQPLNESTLQAVAQDFTLFPEDSDATIAQRRGVTLQQVASLRAGFGNKTTKRLLFPKLAEAELKEQEFEERREDRRLQREQQFLQFQESLNLRRAIAEGNLEARRLARGLQRDKIVEKDLGKRRDSLTSVITLEGINQKLTRALTKMASAGALPNQTGLFSDVAAKVSRHTTLKNDPDIMFFMSFGSEQGIGLARTFQKDIGVRSIAPFQAMIHAIMNPGPLQSMLPILQQWQTELEIAKRAALTPGGFVGPQEVQELQDFMTKLNELNTQGIRVRGFQEVK